MAAESFPNDVLQMFYGPINEENLPHPLELERIYFCRHEKNSEDGCMCGKWMYVELTIKKSFVLQKETKKSLRML